MVLLTHQAVVNRQGLISAHHLTLHSADSAELEQSLLDINHHCPIHRTLLIDMPQLPVSVQIQHWSFSQNMVLCVRLDNTSSASWWTAVENLVAHGIAICLVDYAGEALLQPELFRYSIVGAQHLEHLASAPGLKLVDKIQDQEQFDHCAQHGALGALGYFFLHPGKEEFYEISPSQNQVLRVLQLIRNNRPPQEIEQTLKHDAALSFKLLRFANSAGFGLTGEIHSFHQAIHILGYQKLFKWLSLLLLDGSHNKNSTAILQCAAIRAYFMELCGSASSGRQSDDNLYLTGALSVLVQLFGSKLIDTLVQINLAAAIYESLRQGEGIYAPFLQLARATENTATSNLTQSTDHLMLSAEAVSLNLLKAIHFSNQLDF